jgi:fructose-1,6-bisphosphatase/inositol monophosphatase family enzyme
MVRPHVGLALAATACDIAGAILIGAEEGAAIVDFLFHPGSLARRNNRFLSLMSSATQQILPPL